MEYLGGVVFVGLYVLLYAYKLTVDRVCDKIETKLNERGTK